MSKKRPIKIPEYTLAEELVNAISHGVGVMLAITGMIFCIIKSSSAGSVVASCLYGSMMILLFLLSCIYHSLSPKLRGKKVLRVLDHDNVFLMEAGTFMPMCLGLLLNNGYTALGWTTFGIVWGITILAIVFTSIDIEKFQIVGVICNLVLGWGSLLLLPVFVNIMPLSGILMLVHGGLLYSLGAIWFGIGSKIKWMHSIFHFYVLFGAVFHFLFIYNFCL